MAASGTHYAEVECRVTLLEDALESGQPAASLDDVQARFDGSVGSL